MKVALCIAALVLGLAPSSLHAQPLMQPFYPGFAGLPPQEIMALVRSAGLDPVSRPVRQGPAYVLRALNPAGQEVRIVVDARMGRILKVTAVARTDPGAFAPPESIPSGRAAPDAPSSRVMPLGDDDDDFEPLHPPSTGALPRPRAHTAAKPPLPPLPRPRPKEAGGAASAAPSAAALKPVPASASASAENTSSSAATEIDE